MSDPLRERLTPETADRLALKQRLQTAAARAADCIDAQRYDLAAAVLVGVLDELRARRAQQRQPPTTPEAKG